MNPRLPLLIPLLAALLPAAEPLGIQDAIRQAWAGQSGLQAGAALADRARAEAAAARALRLPTVALAAGVTRSDEPMGVFGARLDQARITQADFAPATLNHPDPLTSLGASLTVTQPLYAGGRLDAARRAGDALAGAEASSQADRRQRVALAVVEAYFGTQAAEQGVRFAQDGLDQARENERFIMARVAQGLLLVSEGERAKAFRAQSEAGLADARQRLASARSALALLLGAEAAPDELGTALDTPAPVLEDRPGARGDLEAARLQLDAARDGVAAARAGRRPEVGLTLAAGTDRYGWSGGGAWTTAAVGAKWTFSFADGPRIQAARAAARAAELDLRWRERQAGREVEEARRALETAQAKLASARVAVAASLSVRAIRTARHREGLLPLVEVLDAETGLSGARALLVASELECRVGQARLALAQGRPIEGVEE